MTRRIFQNLALFLTPLAYGGGLAAAALKFLSPVPPPRRKPRLDAGSAADYSGGAVKAFDFNDHRIWVLQERGKIVALDAQCTHLNCNVNWKPERGSFVCPCHGGAFDRSGNVVLKPPPLPLRQQKVVVEGGRVFLLDEPGEGAS